MNFKRILSVIFVITIVFGNLVVFATEPFQIGTPEEFLAFAQAINNSAIIASAVLTADIDLSGVCYDITSSWKPIGNSEQNAYSGIFDGGGHTISGLYLKSELATYCGLFGYINANGVVKNLSVYGVVSGINAGGIAGQNKGSIDNTISKLRVYGSSQSGGIACSNDGNISNAKNYNMIGTSSGVVGGIAALNNGTISRSQNFGLVLGDLHAQSETYSLSAGGIAGKNTGVIDNVYNFANVSSGEKSGGISGTSSGTIKNVYNTGDVKTYVDYTGGIVALTTGGIIDNAINTGNVKGKIYAGGITGQSASNITNVKNTGNVTSNNKYVGGIVGYSSKTVTNAKNTGDVIGSQYIGGVTGHAYSTYATIINATNSGAVSGSTRIGGIVGDSQSTIDASFNEGTVVGTSDFVGGIVGVSAKNITKSVNKGNVSSASYAGGITGYTGSNMTIADCENYGAVTTANNRSAGIAADLVSSASVLRCANFGVIKGSNHFGGICGSCVGTISDCYNVGAVVNKSYAGGIAGYFTGTITNCFNYVLNGTIRGTTTGTVTNSYQRGETLTELFASGETAYALNAGRKVWSQGSLYPVLVSEINKPICKITTQDKVYYTNSHNAVALPQISGKIWTNTVTGFEIKANTIIENDITALLINGTQSSFITDNAYILTLTAKSITIADKAQLVACINAFNNLSENEKTSLSSEKVLLDALVAVVAEYEKVANVTNSEQLVAALQNENINTINIEKNITLSVEAVISRNITIVGNDNNLDADLTINNAAAVVKNLKLIGELNSNNSQLSVEGIVDLCDGSINLAGGTINITNSVLASKNEEADEPIITATENAEIIGEEMLIKTSIGAVNAYYVTDVFLENTGFNGGLVVPANENEGISHDIYPSYIGTCAYLFLPSTANMSNVIYYTLSDSGERLQRFTANFSNEYENPVKIDSGVFNIKAMQSNLPTLFLNIDESYGTILSMNTSADQSAYGYGDMRLDVPTALANEKGWETTYLSMEDDAATPGTMKMRGRGNSTWDTALNTKKPYQFKTEKRVNLLGMGAAKTWVLLKNDSSLVKNKLGLDLGKEMQVPYSLDSEFVDVFMNGQYLGNYLLSEKVEIDRERLNITNLEEYVEDYGLTANIDLTGGYLVEIDNFGGDILNIKTNNMVVSIKSPENLAATATKDNQYGYIYNRVNDLFNAVFGNGLMPDGKSYIEYIDINSFVRYYWHQEFLANGDLGRGSNNMFKDIDTIDSLVHCGPIWDSDMILHATKGWFSKNLLMQGSGNYPTFFNALLKRKDFVSYAVWYYENTNLAEKMAAASGHLPVYYNYLQRSAKMNQIRWNLSEFNISSMVTTLDSRATWIDNNYLSLKNEATKGEFVEIADPEISKIVLAEFNFKGGTAQADVVGDKELGYNASSGVLAKYAKVFASVDGNNKRKLEWSKDAYVNDGVSAVVPLMTAGSYNHWGTTPYFEVLFSTKDCTNVGFSAKLGGSKKGPKNFKLQYSLDGVTYTDINEATYSIASNKTLYPAFVDVSLPSEVWRKDVVYLRIIATATTTIENGILSANPTSGETSINNIVINGLSDKEWALTEPVASCVSGRNLLTTDVITLTSTDNETIMYKINSGNATKYTGGFAPFAQIDDKSKGVAIEAWVTDGFTESTHTTYNYEWGGDALSKFVIDKTASTVNGKVAATEGLYKNAFITASANGMDAFIPLYDVNGLSISPDDGMKWGKGGYWKFEICTAGYENVVFSLDGASSKKGPASMSLQYSFDDESYITVELNKLIPVTNVQNYYDFYALPASISGKEKVYIRLYIEENRRADLLDTANLFNNESKGNSYINNVSFGGTKIAYSLAMPYNENINNISNRYKSGEIITYISPDNSQLKYSILGVHGVFDYDSGINLSAYSKATLSVWAERDGLKSKINTSTYVNNGTEITAFNLADSLNFDNNAVGATTGNGSLKMYPNGSDATSLTYDAKYGAKASASPQLTWTSSTNNSADGFWLIETSTKNYSNLTLSAKQMSSDNGPRDFCVAYSVDGINYTKMANSSIRLTSNLENSFVNFVLPADLNNQENVYIKIMINGGENMSAQELNDAANSIGKGNTGINDVVLCGVKSSFIQDVSITQTSVSATFFNNMDRKTSFKVIIATYKSTQLQETKIIDISELGVNEKTTLKTVSLENPDFDSVKIFVWDSLGSNKPITEPYCAYNIIF